LRAGLWRDHRHRRRAIHPRRRAGAHRLSRGRGMSAALLQVSDISVAYGTARALFGVDLEVNAGEVVALMGRNGMGKTTTVRAITSMLRPLSGAIRFAGTD